MINFNIVGLKSYSSYLQDKLSQLNLEEMTKVKGYSKQLEILMVAANNMNQEIFEVYNSKYGQHSHYFLFNDNAVQLLRDYDVQINIIDTIDINEDEIPGRNYALLIRSTRFI